MRRPVLISSVFLALAGVAAVLVWNGGCDSAYDISVEMRPSGDAAYPYVAEGAIRGCGINALSGRSGFQLMLRPSGTSISRAHHGSAVVQVTAGISPQDQRKGWYVVTVEKNSTIVASKHDVLSLKP